MQAQHDALAPGDLLLVVGVAEEGQERAVGARRGLDHVRHVALAVGLDDLELHARELGVLLEVVVAAVGDALELAPADREEVLEVARAARVVRELRGVVRADADVVGRDAVAHGTSSCAPRPSSGTTRRPAPGGTKNSISICSNSRVRKRKLPGVISLRNDLPTWAMPNGGRRRAICSTFLKLMKMPCAVSGRR